MDVAQVDDVHKLSGTTADPQNHHQNQESAQSNNQSMPYPPNKLANGTAAEDDLKLANGVSTTDGSTDEAKTSDDPLTQASDDCPYNCHHCRRLGDKKKEHGVVGRQSRDTTSEGRMREDFIVRSIRPVPVTVERKPYLPKHGSRLRNPGTARAYIAATEDKPYGTTHKDWARNHSHQTVLQQHCEFFDTDRDGVIWPQDTFSGWRRLGFGVFWSLFAVLIIHGILSYATVPSWIPDPFCRVYVANIHKDKHGSDSGGFDHEGRFVPQKFEEIFQKYAEGRDYVTIWDITNMLKGQRNIADPIGWGGAGFEWGMTWLMLWPEDGRMMKEEIRGIFDGSLFYKIAARRASNKAYGYE